MLTCFDACPAYRTKETIYCTREQHDRICLIIISAITTIIIPSFLLDVVVLKALLNSENNVGALECTSVITVSTSKHSADFLKTEGNLSEHTAAIYCFTKRDTVFTIVCFVNIF